MKYKRWPIYLSPLIIWLLSQVFFSYPTFFFSALALGALIIALSVKRLAGGDKSRPWYLFIFSPIILFASLSLYSSLISSDYLLQFIFLVSAWYLFSYFRNLYYYWSYGAPERADKLDNLLVIGGLLTVFSLGISMYTLPIFLTWPVYLSVAILTPVIFFTLFQFLVFKVADRQSDWPWILVLSLILGQLAWALYLLPLKAAVLGCLLALSYYFLLVVWRMFNRQELSRHNLKMPLGLFVAILILLLLSASWL